MSGCPLALLFLCVFCSSEKADSDCELSLLCVSILQGSLAVIRFQMVTIPSGTNTEMCEYVCLCAEPVLLTCLQRCAYVCLCVEPLVLSYVLTHITEAAPDVTR